jgi:folate-binding protein YgfZ
MHPSPLLATFRSAHAPLIAWGSTDALSGIDVPAALAPIEMEYAAIRKHCGLLDMAMRGVLEVTGPERLDFLNRMITQELRGTGGAKKAQGMAAADAKPFELGDVRRSFWLNRKGRIDADLRVLNLRDRVLLEVDALAAERTRAGLDSFIIAEDCAIKDITQATHRLALHGPTAWELLRLATSEAGARQPAPDECGEVSIAGAACVLYREDSAGVVGYELIVPADAATKIVGRLIELGHDAAHSEFAEAGRAIALRQAADPTTTIRMQPIGWHAYNLARVEHGTPLFNVDFGPENLPAETGVLEDRVSFTKGCYLGQEVVARMHARGQSKQTLVAVRFAKPADVDGYPPLPEAGAPVGTIGAGGMLTPIGTITSAVPSPMLGMAPVALAQVRTTNATAGTVVVADAEGVRLTGTIQPTLNLWPGSVVRSARGGDGGEGGGNAGGGS